MKYLELCGAIVFATSVAACVHMVSYYDSMSYKNLTDLKGETKVFFESCQKEIATGDQSIGKINGFILSSSKAYEYEKGKNLNDDTVSQLKIIDKAIMEVKLRYAKNIYENNSCKEIGSGKVPNESTGCLTQIYCEAKWKILEAAFDVAISTEQLKIK